MSLDIPHTIIGQSAKIQELLRTLDLIAGTDVPVLITGDIGTGKDLFALRIHEQSLRKKSPFVSVCCKSLQTEDDKSVASIFQNIVKSRMNGTIAKARCGTLFFDEVSELSLDFQAELLHFIETGDVSQNSGKQSNTKMSEFDVRIVVATNKNLYHEVEEGKFRADLYYRLNVIPLELPALSERDNDTSLLIEHFFREFVREKRMPAPSFTKMALNQVLSYKWPGNVRELRNFCERMFILFDGKEIDIGNLPHEIRDYLSLSKQGRTPFSLPESGIKLESLEVDLMLQALDKTSGNKSQAARLLGLTRDTFLYRLKKYSIEI